MNLEQIVTEELIEMQHKMMGTLLKRVRRRLKLGALSPDLIIQIGNIIQQFPKEKKDDSTN